MSNLKVFGINNNSVVESSLSMVASVSDTGKNENMFLIGVNFKGNAEIMSITDPAGIQPKIPMLMLKIDADGLLTEKNSAECLSKTENSNNELHISASNKPPMDSELCTYDNKPEKEIPAHAHLSYREEQVLKLIALGKTRKEIAAQLFLSISTINTYRARILEKMNMKNNADLMRYAFKHRLIE